MPRQLFPGADPTGSLRSLLGLSSVPNVGGLTNRGLDVASGMDAFEPSEQELKDEQGAILDSQRGQTYTYAPSRESLRDDTMSKVRQVLGLQGVRHQQQMETEQAKSGAAMDRFLMQQQGLNDRAQASRDAQMGMLDQRLRAQEAAREDQQAHASGLQDQRLAAAGQGRSFEIPAQMEQSLGKARDSYGGTMAGIARKLHMDGGRQGYDGALTSVLTRMGSLSGLQQEIARGKASGMNGAALIADAAANGVQLHPYEQEYIKLHLGE